MTGTLARTWPTGSMALWVAILLALFVVVYYL
jgi:multicomponent Na+:H+ antiporter subunit D